METINFTQWVSRNCLLLLHYVAIELAHVHTSMQTHVRTHACTHHLQEVDVSSPTPVQEKEKEKNKVDIAGSNQRVARSLSSLQAATTGDSIKGSSLPQPLFL